MNPGIVVVGAGPGGIASAVCAAESGRHVTVIDDNPAEGGQIWRGGTEHTHGHQAAKWFRRLAASGARIVTGSRVVAGDAIERTLTVESADRACVLPYSDLILATGARELFLPFPGWTLPNVMGVGGLQALVKSGLPVAGKRIVVAGSGPLLLAVAAFLRKRGAHVAAICEQASWSRVGRFAFALAGHPGKLVQACGCKASLGLTPYCKGAWVVSALGAGPLQSVLVRRGANTEEIACDYLAVAYGFSPNTELAQLLGCRLEQGLVIVDEFQRASLPGVSCAGELTGLGGVDLSLVEGRIAGFAASGRENEARKLFPARERARRFARILNRSFALRDELKGLPDAQTIVCRCEDVAFGQLQNADSWRSAKLHLRCGMGPCQGRICGPALEFLFAWQPESVRPPIFPARIASMIEEGMKQ